MKRIIVKISELDKINILEEKIEIISQGMKELKKMLGGFLSKYNKYFFKI